MSHILHISTHTEIHIKHFYFMTNGRAMKNISTGTRQTDCATSTPREFINEYTKSGKKLINTERREKCWN